MSDTPTTITQTPSPGEDRSRRRFFRRAVIATLIIGAASGIGVKAFAHGGFGGWHRGGFMGGPIDPARLDAHLDRMLRHLYVEIDATDTQKQQLAPIVKSAVQDLLPVRARLQEARRQGLALLSRPHVDRTALESLRDEQVKLVDQASRRLTKALADVADVLTPEQRSQIAERIGRWHGRRG